MNLSKGQSIQLTKTDGTAMQKIRVGLSWDVASVGKNVDLDVSVVQTGAEKKVAFFNDRAAISGVSLSEDNRTGQGAGEDEFAKFDATKTADGEYFICVNIYEAKERMQGFNLVSNAKALIINEETGAVLAEYKLTEDGGTHSGVIIGSITDTGSTYTFNAKGTFVNGDILEISSAI